MFLPTRIPASSCSHPGPSFQVRENHPFHTCQPLLVQQGSAQPCCVHSKSLAPSARQASKGGVPPSGSLCPHSSWQSTHRHQSPQERAPVEPQISSPGPPKVILCLKISAHCAENEAFGLSLGLIRWCTLEEAAAALGRPLRAVLGQPLGKEKLIGCLGSRTPGLTAFTGSEC